ncbi:YegP family protein [Gordonia sp. GONU]|uniref:YegP family protein n=1 Tax=Gordonia sp. GONU TaxID=2972949 RepID=UPI0021ACECCA|nr:YegP family protein [Gordonia sp. GONU]MCR8897271.1 YegP family protein [Gordonia sp. GONU]
MIVYEKPAEYRGTIEVYDVRGLGWPYDSETPEWRWRCKSRNNTILASGEGYKRRAGALNAIDAQYASRIISERELTADALRILVVPWRLVIHDRHGNIERIGAVY